MTIATRTVNGNNSGPYLRRPKIVVIHSTRSGRDWTDAQELEATLSWFTNPDGSSSHWVISETERVRVVTDDLIAWHSAWINGRSWGVELTQPTSDRAFRDGHYDNAALVGRRYVQMGVKPVWLEYWDGDVTASGFVAHQDTKQGREAGKTDPGLEFDSQRFIASLEDGMPLDDETKDYFAGLMRGVVLALGTGQMNSAMRRGDPDWEPPKDLLDVLNAIGGIQSGSGLTEEETVEAVKKAAREGSN